MATAETRNGRWTFVLDEPTRVLVVDDDPILCEFASVHLATPVATIDTVTDGESALLRLRNHSYDLVLLDIEMPRLDGFSLLAKIRADDSLRQLPVIMLTAHDDIASIDQSYQAGANSFAVKPVNWRQLSYQIRYVIRASRLERGNAQERHDRGKFDGRGRVVVPATEREIDEFLETIVQRADALMGRLSAERFPQRAQALRSIRLFAQQAVAAHPQAECPAQGDDAPSAPTRPPLDLAS